MTLLVVAATTKLPHLQWRRGSILLDIGGINGVPELRVVLLEHWDEDQDREVQEDGHHYHHHEDFAVSVFRGNTTEKVVF